jgi:hypothetical protein
MKCPKCGYKRQLRDDAYVSRKECPSCGTVYSEGSLNPQGIDGQANFPILGAKSAVHESSLIKARERVESRLRKQLENRLKDERHQQTLARAKKIAAAEVRRRQAEWGKKQPNAALSNISAEDTLAEKLTQSQLNAEIAANDTLPTAKNKKPSNISKGSSTLKSQTKVKETDSDVVKLNTAKTLGSPASQSTGSISVTSKSSTQPVVPFKLKAEPSSVADSATFDSMAKPIPQAAMTPAFGHSAQAALSKGLMRVLPMVAWLILMAGIVGAVLSWTTIGDVEASIRSSNLVVGHGVVMPLGLLLGFAYLATGVLGFAFFWVTTMISRQLKDIRRLLVVHPQKISQGK